MDNSETLENLSSALDEAVAVCTEDADSIGILFSGGLDSSLVARFCENSGIQGKLYSTAVAGATDHEHVRKAAEHFRYELVMKTIEPGELLDYAKRVIAAIKTKNPLYVSIGIPLFAACEVARNDGCEVVLVGQGADELFGGYHRYLSMSKNELTEAQKKDVEKLIASDIERDRAIARANSLELKVPYLYDAFVKLAQTIPVELRINNGVRKYILRELARTKGLPAAIYGREKKAVQYSTGVDKSLRQLAKIEKKKIGELLESL